MAKAKDLHLLGSWAFVLGVILAIAIGLFSSQLANLTSTIELVLVVIGLVVGFLSIGAKQSNQFLLAALSLVIVSSLGSAVLGGIIYLGSILNALLLIFIPATIIVALKAVFPMVKA